MCTQYKWSYAKDKKKRKCQMELTFSMWLTNAGEIEKEADYFNISDIPNYSVFRHRQRQPQRMMRWAQPNVIPFWLIGASCQGPRINKVWFSTMLRPAADSSERLNSVAAHERRNVSALDPLYLSFIYIFIGHPIKLSDASANYCLKCFPTCFCVRSKRLVLPATLSSDSRLPSSE